MVEILLKIVLPGRAPTGRGGQCWGGSHERGTPNPG